MSHTSFYAGLTINTSHDKKERLLKLKNIIKEHSHGLLDYEIESEYKDAFYTVTTIPYLKRTTHYLKDDIIIITEDSDFMLGYDDRLDYDQYHFCWPSYLHDLQYIQTKYFQNEEICLHLSNNYDSAYYYHIIYFKGGLIYFDSESKGYEPNSPELTDMLHWDCECNESVEVDWEYVHDRIEKESQNNKNTAPASSVTESSNQFIKVKNKLIDLNKIITIEKKEDRNITGTIIYLLVFVFTTCDGADCTEVEFESQEQRDAAFVSIQSLTKAQIIL